MSHPVAWIVGGVKGLGVPLIKGLAQDGYRIAMNYRKSRQAGEQIQQQLQQSGTETLLMQGDISQVEDVKRMGDEIKQKWGRVDVLVCTAGPFIFKRTPIRELTHQQWKDMVDGNLNSIFYIVHEILPLMRIQRYGRIITFGFPEVEQAPAWEGYGAYAAAKAGLVSLTRTLSREEAPHGITVNMVYPGDIRDPYKEASIQMAKGQIDPQSPVGRPGTGEDISRVVRFLAHPDSDFITGAMIPITGGFTNLQFHVK
ncbi:SDR family oxidoreductase [Hazenella coriacea]|uniref:3-oxoacyl-[acyl-carrier protein] reductase n=1 Tax=Hazenella coriacea TaxID=1179467 RepID=A0A4R3L9U7_9BACL|nr:SDR family oxidoreductase [Hazenella coriacea]TCS95910.1 3-oxoacyl-[acyl-carrier protein] reductase [Hazenella coriacea]